MAAVTTGVLFLLAACAEPPLQPGQEPAPKPSFAKPPSCPPRILLSIDGSTGLSGAFQSDGSDYTESDGVATNNHELVCGLAAMGPNSTGTAVLEVEWRDAGNRYTLRYGKDCGGIVVAANKIATARNNNVWTLTGDAGEGVLCRGRLTGQPSWTFVGTGDAFTMTLTSP
jgi:hypothetical protein